MVQYGFHFDHFEPPRSSQKLCGRLPKASLDIDRRPKPSPKRTSSFSHDKTTHLEDQKRHVGIPNKPQAPPPVELFFDSAPYTSSVKDPTRRRPRVGGFRGPAATCADPGKGVATQRLLRRKLKTRTKFKTPNSKPRLKDPNPKAKQKLKPIFQFSLRTVISCPVD